MILWLEKTLTLSEQGAKDLIKACIACTVYNLMLIVPMGLIYIFLQELFAALEVNTAMLPYPDVISVSLGMAPYVIGAVVIIVISFFAAVWQYDSCFTSAYKESKNTRISLAEKLRKLPLSFFGSRDLADLTTTMLADAAGLETAFSHYVPELVGAVISLVICSVGLFFMDGVMTLSVLWVVPAALIVMAVGKKYLDRVDIINNKNKVIRAESIQEYIENIKEIKSNNQAEKYIGKLDALFKSQVKDTITGELTNAVVVNLAGFLIKLALATAVICGAGRLISRQTDALTFIVFMIAATRILTPVESSLVNIAAMFNAMKQIGRMKEIYDENEQGGEEIPENSYDGYDIVFDNVSFSYKSGDKVIRDISFRAKQGEVTALIGPSGGGKSTCTKLAARFWDIQSGKITVGGRDISKINPEQLLKSYSIVFQDVLLFNATIMENIRLGKLGASDEEVRRAAAAANCEEFIKKLPDGYDTLIGENGSQLSGGERQRISIARAILKNAPIVLLDEATASLDVENESKVQAALSALLKDKTVLVIAHRMRTIANADHIIVLSEGRISEEGSPAELMKKNGSYARMCRLQGESAEWNI